ncbi:MAG: ATP-binding protein [Acidobacteriaceae bacterium]
MVRRKFKPWSEPQCAPSQRYERGSTMVTSNLPFQEWTEVLGSERLTGALLDRLTHHVHILEMNGDSYRLKQSRRKRGA